MIAIIDYGINNLDSVKNAFDRLEVDSIVTSDFNIISRANALILPGVGTAIEGMRNLKKLRIDKLLTSEVRNGKPLLGICLGMQLLMDWSEEGNVDCLGLIDGTVEKFTNKLKVPQIGWNNVKISNFELPITNQIAQNSYFYFVHSYYCIPTDANISLGITSYGLDYCSIFAKNNIVCVQFHPEKSGKVGFQLLRNFINYIT